jgi:hypothetical protein
MELNSISLSDFTKLATVIWLKAKDSVPTTMRTSGIFQVVPIPSNSGETREFSEIDGNEYASVKGQSDQAARARVLQGYSKTMRVYRVAQDIGISYEMRKFNKYPEVVSRLTNLGRLADNRMDLDLAHRITYAASTSYTDMDGRTVATTTGDGFQLAYTAHRTTAANSKTYRNILANNPQLSDGSLEAMERLIVENTINNAGEKMTMPFDILWTTDDPTTVNMAKKLLKSTAAVDGLNSGVINVNSSKYRHIILPRVATDNVGAVDTTKSKYWGLVSSSYSSAYLGVWEEAHLKTPSDLNAGEEFSTDDWNFGVRAGYGIEIVSGQWFKMSKGDGTA